MRAWIDETRALSGRMPRRYASIEEALQRMQEENPHLSAEQARHLTQHGVNQNEDGTYSWKFDNYVRVWPPYDMTRDEIASLWSRITCPDPADPRQGKLGEKPRQEDGRAAYFRDARVLGVEGAGHWVHHDRLDLFLQEVAVVPDGVRLIGPRIDMLLTQSYQSSGLKPEHEFSPDLRAPMPNAFRSPRKTRMSPHSATASSPS